MYRCRKVRFFHKRTAQKWEYIVNKKKYIFLLFFFAMFAGLFAKTVRVPVDYKSIQTAVNAVQAGDTIQVAGGRYDETLQIQKPVVIIGSGSGSCVLYKSSTSDLHVNIREATVEFRGMEFNGGNYDGRQGHYAGASRNCILADFSTLKLYDVQFNQYINYIVTVKRGFLTADHVSMQTRPYFRYQCDIGFSLVACVAEIDHFKQEFGWIDHTIDVNPGNFLGPSSLDIKNSSIWASHKTWGDCIRVYRDVLLTVDQCSFYRAPGGDKPGTGHTGIAIAANNDIGAKIINNRFTNIPWAISFYGAAVNSSQVLVENNLFKDCAIGGIRILCAHSPGIDLGGGHLGGRGRNRFVNSATYDVQLETTFHDVYALYNWWSHGNPATGIWDKHDDPQINGEVLYKSVPQSPRPQLPANESYNQSVFSQFTWEPAGSAFYYHLQVAMDRAFEHIVFDVPELVDTRYDPGGLAVSTTYFWRVRAFNGEGGGEWSEIYSFQTSAFLPPPPPEPVEPFDGSEEISPPFFLAWKIVGGEVWYFIEVSQDEAFGSVVLRDSTFMGNEYPVKDLEAETTYFWRVRAENKGGAGLWSPVFCFKTAKSETPVFASERTNMPFRLSRAYPNPFNAATTIEYTVPKETRVRITIYSIAGRIVKDLDLGRVKAGVYQYRWRPGPMPSGIYFYRIQTGYNRATGRCLLVK